MDAVDEFLVFGIIEVTDAEHSFGLTVAIIGEVNGFGFDIESEIDLGFKHLRKAVGDHVLAGRALFAARNN